MDPKPAPHAPSRARTPDVKRIITENTPFARFLLGFKTLPDETRTAILKLAPDADKGR
ncbi:MAG: hypothetical protein PW734_04880 [Verrucomicrobium sp.]|nr:hypothetical protein [Verrucomicrobium sp.]